jgi:hypothetical protein
MTYPKTQSESVAFRENFDSVASVIDNGGTPSNGAVIDKSFTGTGNGEVITYADKPLITNFFSEERSVEVEFTASSVGESIGVIVCKEGGNTGWSIFLSDDTGSAAKLNFFQYFTTTDGRWRTVSAVITYGTRYTLGVTYDSSSTANNPVITLDGVVVSITEVFTPAGTADDDTAQAFKVGNTLATGQSFDGSVYGVSLYSSAKTTEEFLDITEQDTFSEIDESKTLISLPLRANYISGGSQVTENKGNMGSTAILGDGTTASTFPTQLTPKGMLFDGSTDYIDITDLIGTSLDNSTSCTVSVMIKALSHPGNAALISDASTFRLFHFQTAGSTGVQAFVYGPDTSCLSTVPIPLGVWHHVGFTYDGANVKLYQDGVLTKTEAGTAPMDPISTSKLEVGRGFSGGRHFDGTIAQPEIRDFACSATQMAELSRRAHKLINK